MEFNQFIEEVAQGKWKLRNPNAVSLGTIKIQFIPNPVPRLNKCEIDSTVSGGSVDKILST
jgi:hypothetical protein